MSTAEACPTYTFGALWYFCEDYYSLIGLICLLGGLWLLMVGGRYYRITMFFCTVFFVGIAIVVVLFSTIFPDSSPNWSVWLALVNTFGVGCYLGYAA
jgi:hypothetical protein